MFKTTTNDHISQLKIKCPRCYKVFCYNVNDEETLKRIFVEKDFVWYLDMKTILPCQHQRKNFMSKLIKVMEENGVTYLNSDFC